MILCGHTDEVFISVATFIVFDVIIDDVSDDILLILGLEKE